MALLLGAELSDWFGWVSMACWLCAQFPQVVVNWQLKSADGLALPFLINWLFGDITNLVGCILTHQLPFQLYVAIYFCLVDVTLDFQYFYYTPLSRWFLPFPSKASPATPGYAHAGLPRSANVSVARNRSKSQSLSVEVHSPLTRLSLARGSETEDGAMHERSPPWTAPGLVGRVRSGTDDSMRHDQDRGERERGHSRRPLSRRESSKRRSTAEGARKAGMVFLSIGGLVGVGRMSGGLWAERGVGVGIRAGADLGRVVGSVVIHDEPPIPTSFSPSPFLHPTLLTIINPPPPTSFSAYDESDASKPSTERIIGRVSAWICTTLYLTSRLPQIWKNFVRKSVQGLSMSLFIFAFLGNLFYVLSIITSPNMSGPPTSARAFIFESIPYILGSGGVLIFDMTIVFQGWLYANRKPIDVFEQVIAEGDADVSETNARRGRSRARRPTPIGLDETDPLLADTVPVAETPVAGESGEAEGYGTLSSGYPGTHAASDSH